MCVNHPYLHAIIRTDIKAPLLPGTNGPVDPTAPPVAWHRSKRGIMRPATTAVLLVGGLLTLGACGSNGMAPSAATAKPTVTAAPSIAASATAEATPAVEKHIITKTRAIPYTTRKVHDPTVSMGTTKVRSMGAPGVKTLTYEVTFTNGVQTSKRLLRAVTTRAPVERVIAIGTKQTPQCDPNYSGACVPIASDVDCAGGSGDGPAYVQGPVRVVGTDIYGLDRDGDGIGCET